MDQEATAEDEQEETEVAGGVLMPQPYRIPCPLCGNPMTQKSKEAGSSLYYYCKGFGTVPPCGYSVGLKVSRTDVNKHRAAIVAGDAEWTFDADENRYRLIRLE